MPEAEDNARPVAPYVKIRRGEDMLDDDNNLIVSDFGPRIVSADTPDEVEPDPKDDSYVQESAEELRKSLEETKATPPSELPVNPASETASKEPKKASTTKSDSSSAPKSG